MVAGEKRMTWTEVIEEVDWFLAHGVHPELIASNLGRSLAALERLCRTHDRPDLSTVFNRAIPHRPLSREAQDRKNAKMRVRG